jgi:hypothetical protein
MKRKLMIVAAVLVLVGAGFPTSGGAQMRPPVQGVLADINESPAHRGRALPIANATGSSFILGGQEYFVTSSTRIFSADGKPMTFNQLSHCVGTVIRAWSKDVGPYHVVDRIDLDAACASSARSGVSTITGDSGQSAGSSDGGRSIASDTPPAGRFHHEREQ